MNSNYVDNELFFYNGIRDHVDLCEKLGLADFSRGGKVSGSGFYYLKGFGARLEWALIQYAMDFVESYTKRKNINKKIWKKKDEYLPVCVPDVVRYEVVEACGFHPRSSDPQTYFVDSHLGRSSQKEGSDDETVITPGTLCLSATAEFPVSCIFFYVKLCVYF
jgi:seryl-tRNA synthetase